MENSQMELYDKYICSYHFHFLVLVKPNTSAHPTNADYIWLQKLLSRVEARDKL